MPDIIDEHPFPVITGVCSHEVVSSPAYIFDNSQRGDVPQIILQQTLCGTGEFIWRGTGHQVSERALFIAVIPESSVYRYPPGQDREWVFRWINIRGIATVPLWKQLRQRFGVVVQLSAQSAADHALGNLIKAGEDRRLRGTRNVAESLYSLFVTLWLELEGADTSVPRSAAALHEAIRNNYHDPVNLKELCIRLGQSREHLSRLFTKSYGISPATYLRELRMEAARNFLRQSTLPVYDIARRCGYLDPKRFSKSFTVTTGFSPARFRKNA